jgi:hypothetical protein
MKITKLRIVAKDVSIKDRYLDDLFDAKTGYGTIPNSESIDYFGFTIYMKPSEFLSLAANATLKPEFYEQLVKEKEPLGYPCLFVKHEEDQGYWTIMSHEGRHRMKAVQNVLGDNHLIPVHIFPQYMRTRNLNPTLLAMPFLPEKVDIGNKTLREAHSLLHYLDPTRIDVKSSHLNVGKLERKTDYKHPALAAQWQSDMNRTHSPADLKKNKTNEDDISEVVDDVVQPMHEYKNACQAPHGISLPRRIN